jgi:uncharacterized protein YceK
MRFDERLVVFVLFTLDIPVSLVTDTLLFPLDFINMKDNTSQPETPASGK